MIQGDVRRGSKLFLGLQRRCRQFRFSNCLPGARQGTAPAKRLIRANSCEDAQLQQKDQQKHAQAQLVPEIVRLLPFGINSCRLWLTMANHSRCPRNHQAGWVVAPCCTPKRGLTKARTHVRTYPGSDSRGQDFLTHPHTRNARTSKASGPAVTEAASGRHPHYLPQTREAAAPSDFVSAYDL